MINADQTNQIKDLLAIAPTVLVVLAPEATTDQAAAAAALYLSLQAAGKHVSFLTPRDQPQLPSNISALDQLQTQLGNQDLTVSFPYRPEAVDKVSYHLDEDNQKFYLVIKPQKGQTPLDPAAVEYSYTGADADLIFLVGIHTYESLEQLYFGYETLYEKVPVITFHTFEPAIGSIKVDASGTSSLSESMVGFLFAIGTPPESEAATNLLWAIEEATDNFRSFATTAETFDMVAYLLRQGARRQKRTPTSFAFPPTKGAGEEVSRPVRQEPSRPPRESLSREQPHRQPTSFTDNPLANAMKSKNGPAENTQSRQAGKKKKNKAGDLHHQPSGFSPSGGG